MTDRWFDDAAGPVVRPYAVTRGRTAGAGGGLDPVAVVIAEPGEGKRAAEASAPGAFEERGAHPPSHAPGALGPEHMDIVARCRRSPQPVAALAAGMDLPVGVVRVLVGDLVAAGLVRVTRPVPPAELPDERVLRDVIDGLRAL
ncbi:DUF742 domain-containing protein [Streptomyces sp. TRM43335]|uniref:DUF742 domain-containing protein n=1 Tax=Streptomyces taklimakanensis TaxID=2569853 RepID=A0A6G2BID0_9ACTN|nr:DUF742 domain-containing protein [Streptomyces taklimakanensis]MTE22047.1 DUF742 domain-containing protein [Streptomyces taklimakanensis]